MSIRVEIEVRPWKDTDFPFRQFVGNRTDYRVRLINIIWNIIYIYIYIEGSVRKTDAIEIRFDSVGWRCVSSSIIGSERKHGN